MQNQVPDAPWASLDNMPGDDEESLDVLGFLSRRKSFIIVLALFGSGLGYLHFQRQTQEFKSTAMLQVIHHNQQDAMNAGMLATRSLMDAQFEITSFKLLEDSIENHDLMRLPTLSGLDRAVAVQRLAEMIEAKPARDAANILLISCIGEQTDDIKIMADAVSEEYIAHQEATYTSAVDDLQDLLETAKNELNESLRTLEDDFEAFDKTSGLLSDGANPHHEQLQSLRTKINSLTIRDAELQAEYETLTTALAAGKDRNALLMLIGKQVEQEQVTVNTTEPSGDRLEKDRELSTASSMYKAMMPLLLQESLLSQELGSGHPKLVALRREIEMTQQYYEQLVAMQRSDETRSETENDVAPIEELDFISIYLTSLSEEQQVLTQQKSSLEKLALSEENEARKLRAFEHQQAAFTRKIARETSLLEEIQQQMRDTELPTNMGGVSATILSAASPGFLIYPKLSSFLGLGAFLGALVGLGLGYIVEVADHSFRKPEDIVREFGVPIVGHIPYIKDKNLQEAAAKSAFDLTVVTQHLPRSRAAEAYRAVRTAVCFSAIGRHHKVIQVTSPAAGDGKSTLAQNFAVALAQSGKTTLIVESDFRRPKVHKLTGVSNRSGIVDVLRGEVEVDDAIKETEIENLSVMPCGSRPNNPSELLTRPEYEHLLEVLRQKFEYVIIDTPPVLVVTDPCSVAPRVDGVLLCVRLSRHTRDFGRRALEQLRDVGANMTGIVINGVEESDAYGYGNYNYSDYRYRYRDYSYDSKSSDDYFEEPENSVETSEQPAGIGSH